MAVFNAAKREIDLKIVYYGPAMCGKTTNVQCIHKMLAPQQRGELMSLATKDDRTLFFDFLPIELGDVRGFKTRFHIYTVPGQVYYALTRRAVLTGADGVVFVVDSQSNKLQENIESLKDLAENLRFYKKDLTAFPFVLQYNKRDLPNVMPTEELNTMLNTLNVPSLESSAVTGMGVVETLTTICKIVLKQMDSGTAKKKPLQPSVRPIARPAPIADDSGIHIFNQQPAAAPSARQTETVSPQPAKPAPAAQTTPVPAAIPERPPLRLQTSEPASPAFTDINPLQTKKTAEFIPEIKDTSPGAGFSPAADSFGKEESFDEDFTDLMIEESVDAAAEPELSFEDDSSPGLEFDEPAPETAEPELSFEEDSSTGLEFDEPALEPAEPELDFDDDASDLIIEEPATAEEEAVTFEEDASGLVLDEEETPAEQTGPSADTRFQTLDEPPSVKFEEPPVFEDSFSEPAQKETSAQIKIISCGQPQKISDSVVKLPVTLRLKDDAEYPILVTITFENAPVQKLP